MKYEEYRIVLEGGLEKKLGILGETHLYRPEETEFAGEVVKNYDVIASEGSDKKNLSNRLMSLALLPSYLLVSPYLNYYGRSFHNKNSLEIARQQNKEIKIFDDLKYIGLGKKLLIFTLPFFTLAFLPLLPFIYLYNRITKRTSKREKKKGIFSRITDYLASRKERDQHMAKKSIDYLQESNNLLIRCGLGHIEGITGYIGKDSRVKEVKKIYENAPRYNPKIAPLPIYEPVY